MGDLAREYAAKVEDCQTLELEIAQAAAERERLLHEAEGVKEELEHAGQRLAELEGTVSDYQGMIQELEAHIRETNVDAVVSERVIEIKQELEARKAECNELRALAEETDTLQLEKERLSEENSLLEKRLVELEAALAMEKQLLGHGNQRQKIQYHLRLKQELEEMRHECTALLRERFHLEQCVRLLMVNGTVSGGEEWGETPGTHLNHEGAHRRRQRTVHHSCHAVHAVLHTWQLPLVNKRCMWPVQVLPDSLVENAQFLTPTSRKILMAKARSSLGLSEEPTEGKENQSTLSNKGEIQCGKPIRPTLLNPKSAWCKHSQLMCPDP
eukprot:scaffold60891_cov44-Prasinocladus_malaysianus.AAC.2